ncbi:MAG: prephenate dehydrogenase [Anaerolineales bacterium]
MSSVQTSPPADQRPLLADQRIAIYGLGLMGGSLALALRGRAAQLIGIDPDPSTRSLAIKNQVVDQVYDFPPGDDPRPTLIILAATVQTNLHILAQLPEIHAGPAVILDLGSTKRTTLHAMELLPEYFDPIGGHPMCGKESSGLANATGQLFDQAVFALCPTLRTSEFASALASALVAEVGAQPYWLDANEHDLWVASTSHLPYLVSNVLAARTPEDAAALIGSGFISTSRLAASNLEMIMDILLTNRENILTVLADYTARLEQIETLLELENIAGLKQALQQGAEKRKLLITKKPGNA